MYPSHFVSIFRVVISAVIVGNSAEISHFGTQKYPRDRQTFAISVLILFASRGLHSDVEERWASLGIRTTQLPHSQLLTLLTSPRERANLLADAIVLECGTGWPIQSRRRDVFEPAAAVDLARQIRQLDETVAMQDGRRWSALPVRILAPTATADFFVVRAAVQEAIAHGFQDINAHELTATDNYAASALKDDVKRYRQAVLDELDNLGFIVTYEGGRYRLGPALKPRPELVGHYYFGPADKRPDHFVTIDRDLVGIQLEVELLEALLNQKDASERDFQKFFEKHPHFLSMLAMPLPHVQLRDSGGHLLIPDFILKPIVAAQRDSRWEVLDLKTPHASLIVGKGTRRRLSHAVHDAVRQLRDYGDYFADPSNTETIEHTLGHRLRKPKLGVLIGRIVEAEIEALEAEQSRLPDVRIVTYDEVLQQQKVLVS